VGRYGESSRAGPSVIGRPVRRLPPSRGVLATWTAGDIAVELPRPGQTGGPSPEERHPVYPQRFNWFESTPYPHPETLRDYRSKPTIIQLVNHIVTHVMSNENKFPLKKIDV
jgi:hypothetical protein